jgi:uncharacterized protein YqgV (UPF0045/DUF77 family)
MSKTAAQVSLYPLRSAHVSPGVEQALRVFRARGLSVRPGDMSTLVTGDNEEVFKSLKELFDQAARQGDVVMVVTLSNACPMSESPPSQDL